MTKKKQVIPLTGWTEKEKAIGAINRLDLSQSWEVVIQPHVSRRSMPQNDLFWLWASTAAKFFSSKGTKYTKDDIATIWKHLFLGYVTQVIGRTEIKDQLRSTTDLDKQEFTEFLQSIDAWSAEHGLLLPTPEGSEFAKQKDKIKEANN